MGGRFRITEEQVRQFDRDGYLFVPELFDAGEMDLLLKIAKADQALQGEAYGRKDAQGNITKLALRNHLPEGMYSAIVRSSRIAEAMGKLLRDEVYHWHHKMMLKEPFTGGAWEWHQDYGYWYNDGCLFPDMASCLIAVDRANKANGCLQVIKGSHRMGRVHHGLSGEQVGADQQRVDEALKRMELVYCEMEPGTGLFFHGNLLHRSDQNTSPHSRWSLICCYNAKRNDPFKTTRQPHYSPMEIWDDERVREAGRKQWESMMAETKA